MNRCLAALFATAAAAAVSAPLSAAPITANDLPKLKAGLWEVRTVNERSQAQPQGQSPTQPQGQSPTQPQGQPQAQPAQPQGQPAQPQARPAQISTMCLDDTVQREMFQMSTGMMAGMCSRHDLDLTAGKVTAVADCDIGVAKMRSRSVMTLHGDTSYRTEAHASFEPPLNGQAESATVIEGRYVGACRPGQKPGDITLPNGRVINMRQMMPAGKG